MNDGYVKLSDVIKMMMDNPDMTADEKASIILRLISLRVEKVRRVVEGEWREEHKEDAPIVFKRRWVCTVCGDYQTYGRTRYCPNCGNPMKVEEK